MNRRKQLIDLMSVFSEEKKFITDGYYRIRTTDESTIELAYLIIGPCGESIVHPQITVFLDDKQAIGTTLIDQGCTPALFLQRDADNALEIDTALDLLIDRFSKSL